MEQFLVPAGEGASEYMEKKSRFLGLITPVTTEAEARARLEAVKKREYDARHNCWCYLVGESIVVQRGDKLVGLVHPDMDAAKQLGFSIGDLGDVMEENRKQLNSLLPAFCKVSAIQIHEQEFEKTPKKSIKRYLYK